MREESGIGDRIHQLLSLREVPFFGWETLTPDVPGDAIRRSVNAGVKSIEHGQLMAEKGIWLVTQPFEYNPELQKQATPVQREKYMTVVNGWKQTAELIKKYHLKMGFGTDLMFDPANNGQQGDWLARFSTWFSNVEL
jgi:imidazolonepropionase-like amidohydrolase